MPVNRPFQDRLTGTRADGAVSESSQDAERLAGPVVDALDSFNSLVQSPLRIHGCSACETASRAHRSGCVISTQRFVTTWGVPCFT
jgi:hypothetical protein